MIFQCIISLDYRIINFGQNNYWASEKGFYKSSFVWTSLGEVIWGEFYFSFIGWGVGVSVVACTAIEIGVRISKACQYVTKSLVIWRVFKVVTEHFAFEFGEVCSVFVAKFLGLLWFFSLVNELKSLWDAGLILTSAKTRNSALFQQVYHQVEQWYEIISSTCRVEFHLV